MNPLAATNLTNALLHAEPAESMPQIEGYRIERELGRGSGGVVYHAHALASDRPVALKVFHTDKRSPERVDRAWRELDILSSIRSPSVPHVIDYGASTGLMYIATELIEGPNLLRHTQDRSLSQRQRVELLARIADAAQTLHEHGVIHRDLKPSNILITPQGDPVIIDLGIAGLIESDVMQTLTADGAPIGTPAYMAPEQARGERDQISTRSDVYALGAIAYLLLTGDTPHELATTIFTSVQRVGHDEPRPAREIEPALPRALASVLERACARRPRDRYESAAALGEDLRRWLNREPVTAGRQRPWARTTRWAAKHPVLTTIALCASMLAGTVGLSYATVWWLNGQPHSIVAIGKGMAVQIRSRSGSVLKEFTGAGDDTYRVAQIGRTPGGAPKYFVISVKAASSAHADLPVGVHVFRPGNLDEPLWSYTPDALPPQLRYAADETPSGDAFRAYAVCVADVLPPPGPEIISVHCHDPFSPAAIAIHTPEGRLLDLVWHDGRLNAVNAYPGSSTIVCAGVNSELNLGELGIDVQHPDRAPTIVFAYTPRLGRTEGFIANDPDLATVNTLWNYTLLPLRASESLNLKRSALLTDTNGPAPMMRVTFELTDNKIGSVAFYISEDGVWKRGYPNDAYRNHDDVIPIDELELGELPEPPAAPSSNSKP